MVKKRMFLLSLMILIIACQSTTEEESERILPVKVYHVKKDSISDYLEITGNLEAHNEAMIFSQVSEKMDKIYKNVGSYVAKDDIIAILENRLWEQSLKQAEASLQSIEARHEQMRSDYERYQRLYQEKAVSQQQWEKIRTSMQETEASLAQLRAAYQQAKEQFENTFIKAPFNGIVGSLYFDEGQMVPLGQPVAKIVNTNLMRARLNIPDIHMNKVRIGQLVFAQFPSLPDKLFQGTIKQIDPAIDPLSRTIEVEVIFPNNSDELKSGMYGLFRLEIEKRLNTFVVPDNAIIRKTEVKINPETGETFTIQRHFVFVAEKDTARLTEVKLGLESNNRVQITKGLKEQDYVIVLGQKLAKDRQKISIIED